MFGISHPVLSLFRNPAKLRSSKIMCYLNWSKFPLALKDLSRQSIFQVSVGLYELQYFSFYQSFPIYSCIFYVVFFPISAARVNIYINLFINTVFTQISPTFSSRSSSLSSKSSCCRHHSYSTWTWALNFPARAWLNYTHKQIHIHANTDD